MAWSASARIVSLKPGGIRFGSPAHIIPPVIAAVMANPRDHAHAGLAMMEG